MKYTGIGIVRRLRLTVFLLIGLAAAAAGAEYPKVTVETTLDGGRTFANAIVRPIADSRYLIWTGEHLYEVPGEVILTVDGKTEFPEPEGGWPRLIDYETYEEIQPSGDVVVWSRTNTRNQSTRMVTRLSWGVGANELDYYRSLEAFDGYGNRLTTRIEPRDDGSGAYLLTLDFVVPVEPDEAFGFSLRALRQRAARHEGDVFTYTFRGDFPEDRIYKRKLRLPAGAEILETTGSPRIIEHAGNLYAMWLHYYPQGKVEDLTVRYRLH